MAYNQTMPESAFHPYQQQITDLQQQIAKDQTLLKTPDFQADPELSQLLLDEIAQLETQVKTLEELAADFLGQQQKSKPGSSLDPNASAIIEIRGGAGGDEAKIWASDLLRMYSRFAENLGLKIEIIDDLIFKVRGKASLPRYQMTTTADGEMHASATEEEENLSAFALFRYESGVHRVQRVPVTEAAGRIHTSTASVAVLPEIAPHLIEIKEEDLEWQFMRSGGAGGQSVNKTNSAVRLIHHPSGIVVNARQERKQFQNRQIALDLLRSQLWQIEEDKKMEELGEARESIGRNMRAEKIKTYNFPQNRLTDHRIHHSWHSLDQILEGNLTEVIALTRCLLLSPSSEKMANSAEELEE